MMKTFEIGKETLTFDHLDALVNERHQLILSDKARDRVISCRKYLEEKLKLEPEPIYGVNTGFGSLHHVKIEGEKMEALQHNLVVSHASGTGDRVPIDITRLMLFLKIQSLAYGHSAIRLETMERMIEFYNLEITPVTYQQGSLGASGDLAPLAHMALPLLGLGEVYIAGEKKQAQEVLEMQGWDPLVLSAKEGLAILNGTQFMSAYGCRAIIQAERLARIADISGALSLDGFNCRIEPFDALIQEVRPHKGQIDVAKNIRGLINGSEINHQHKSQVQDPYSFRCIPQVHGASRQTTDFVKEVFQTEINAVSDNPNVYPKQDKILSGGNFHGEILAMALDFLCIALSELGSISERRTYQLLTGKRDLPAYLTPDPGLSSGLMTPHYTAAALVSENKHLSTPASVDSIVSSDGQEDHVSMGAYAATKAFRIIKNLERILSIELQASTQAIEMRKPLKTSPRLQAIIKDYRNVVPTLTVDRPTQPDIEAGVLFIRSLAI